jgi:hypothetical protein
VFLDLRTPAEWCAEYGVTILAWDGWDGPDPLDVNGPLGLAEFYRRASKSSTEHKLDAFERIEADLAARRAERKPAVMAILGRARALRGNRSSGRVLRLTRPLPAQSWWPEGLEAGLATGAIVHEFRGVTYGCVTSDGIAVSMVPGETPFFELPRDAVEDVTEYADNPNLGA